ncbi:MAG: AAA family ATPase, partial [Chloroflexi bacterium]|nr:AAA family ATPase [Chloroflexota bacterium]
MRISELFVDGFGHFHDYAVGPLTSRLVIFYGRNEAGKSTLLEFIRTVLFGFPTRNRDSHFHPINGGRHGGRLTVVDDAEGLYTIERHVGGGGGAVTLSDSSGNLMPESRLSVLLGNTSSDVFKTVFAFSLGELQAGNVLSDANVNGQVYSVGLGATRLPDAFKSLQSKRDKIYLPSGRKQVVAELVSQLRAVDEKLAEIRNNVDHYATLVADRERLTTAIQVADVEVRSLESDRRELRRITDAWEDWTALVEAEGQIEKLPHFEAFPNDAIGRLEKIEVLIRGAEEELEDATVTLERAREFARTPIDDEAMAEDSEAISDINRGRSAFDGSNKDLPERRAELTSMEKSLQERLRNLGPSWDEKRLESFDNSMSVRNDIERFQRELSQKQDALDHDRNLAAQEERLHSEAVESARRAEEALSKADEPGLDRERIDQRRAALRSSRTIFDELERKRQNYSNLRFELEARPVDSPKGSRIRLTSRFVLGLVLNGLGIAFIVTGVVSETPLSGPIGIMSGLVLIAIGVVVLSIRDPEPAEPEGVADPFADRVDAALKEQNFTEEELREIAESLGLDGLDAVGLDEAERQLDLTERSFADWTSLNTDHHAAIATVERRERGLETAAGRAELSEAALATSEDQWKAWLKKRDLPDTFLPETMVEFRGQVESALLEQRQVKQMRHRVEAIEEDIRQYTSDVEPLAAKYAALPDSKETASIAAKADSLIARHAAAHDKMNLRKRA